MDPKRLQQKFVFGMEKNKKKSDLYHSIQKEIHWVQNHTKSKTIVENQHKLKMYLIQLNNDKNISLK